MLTHLAIQNVVLIDKADLEFPAKANLCILTGETGSGKSILLNALGLAIGLRSNLRLIGKESDKAQVTAEFDITNNQNCQNLLQEHDLIDAENPNLVRIRRSINKNSSSKAYLNDITIGLNLLAQIGETLIEIHGQHDQRGLLNPSSHMEILDEFSDNKSLLKEIGTTYDKIKSAENQLTQLKAKKEQAQREKDYLEHVIRELEDANIEENEENELISKKDLLVGKEKIINFLLELKSNITEANSQLFTSQKILIRNQNIIDNFLSDEQENFSKLSEEIDQQSTVLDGAITNFENIIDEVSNSENNLAEVEERLLHIRSLARKFNVRVEELNNVILDSKEKLELLENEEEISYNLENELKTLNKNYQDLALKIRGKRQNAATILAKKVEDELAFLKMAGTKFKINLEELNQAEERISPTGLDKIQFQASINNNDFDNISKIASGGELSRFMLALKVALMDVRSVPTMIFDEIDTGIGGSTADVVGKRLAILAKNLQIFVVTHQAQIAAKADIHFKISKASNDDKVTTLIEELKASERKNEIARMISGETISAEALKTAKILIEG